MSAMLDRRAKCRSFGPGVLPVCDSGEALGIESSPLWKCGIVQVLGGPDHPLHHTDTAANHPGKLHDTHLGVTFSEPSDLILDALTDPIL